MDENKEILVSVICLTYNHERYIRECVDSLINQKTSFKYEILIHDDCSTDKTTQILKEYERRYPKIIRIILQNENQYTKGKRIVEEIVLPIANGRYIAFCEGDDYWIDSKKLQKQIDALKEYPECWICAHNVKKIDTISKKKIGNVAPSNKNKILSIEEVIDGDGGFVGTNSLVINRKAFEMNYEFEKMYSLDYFIQIMGSLHGGMLYLADEMSVYRTGVENSWTRFMEHNIDEYSLHLNRIILTLKKLDEETKERYHDVINKKICCQKFKRIYARREYKLLLKKSNCEIVKVMSLDEKFKVVIKIIFPWIDDLIVMWRKKVAK